MSTRDDGGFQSGSGHSFDDGLIASRGASGGGAGTPGASTPTARLGAISGAAAVHTRIDHAAALIDIARSDLIPRLQSGRDADAARTLRRDLADLDRDLREARRLTRDPEERAEIAELAATAETLRTEAAPLLTRATPDLTPLPLPGSPLIAHGDHSAAFELDAKPNVIDASSAFTAASDAAAVLRRTTGAAMDDAATPERAARGVAGSGSPLPHLETIQRSFGAHDLSGVQAHVGGAAADASASIGAEAYATGNHVAFASSPSLFVAAHEAAHVVQQRAGVHLLGGVGQSGDTYEQRADAVADRVVRGESAEELLGSLASGNASSVVQRLSRNDSQTLATLAFRTVAVKARDAEAVIARALEDGADDVANLSRRLAGPLVLYLREALDAASKGGNGLDAEYVRAAVHQASLFHTVLVDETYEQELLDEILEAAQLYEKVTGAPLDAWAETPTPDALSKTERKELVRLSLVSARDRLVTVLDAEDDDANADSQLRDATAVATQEMQCALIAIKSGSRSGRERSRWAEQVDDLSSVITRVDRWLKAGQLDWDARFVSLFRIEARLRELVGADSIARSQGSRPDVDDVAETLKVNDAGREPSGADESPFDSKASAINAIAHSAASYCDTMKDVVGELADALAEPSPVEDQDLLSELLLAAIQASVVGGTAGAALALAERIGHRRGYSEPMIETFKAAFEEAALSGGELATDAVGGTDAEGGEAQKAALDTISLRDPRHVFVSSLRNRMTAMEDAVFASVESRRTQLEELDLQTLNDVHTAIAGDGERKRFRATYSANLVLEWLNFCARVSAGASPGDDVALPDHLGNTKGFLYVDVEVDVRGGTGRRVRAELAAESAMTETMKRNPQLADARLEDVPLHRVYLISPTGAAKTARVMMGPSGRIAVDALTDDDLTALRLCLLDGVSDGSLVAAAVPRSVVVERLEALITEVNASFTLDEVLE